MNWYEHHIRDYDAATQHLSWDEDMAYARLLRWYYRKEQPIPADINEACRQVRATSKVQREAVEQVLREFFVLRDDGWHQDTCDAVIAAYHAGEPEREQKKINEDTRMTRHRAERAALFKALNDRGQHAPWNTKMEELRAMVTALDAVSATAPATPATPATRPETAPATPATATHGNVYPPTTHHPPLPKEGIQVSGANAPSSAPPTLPGIEEPPPGGQARPTIPCPYGAIVDAYHAALPNLPTVQLRDGPTWKKREKAMREMWGWVLSSRRPDGTRRAETAEQALTWFGEYFARAAENDFVMGRTKPSAEHANWRADFDYLLSPKGMKQVIEKTQEAA